MSHLTKDCYPVPEDREPKEFRDWIYDTLCPEFEWCDHWHPCQPVVTCVRRRDGEHWYLQPFLLSVAGASVPSNIPVRMRLDGHQLMQDVRKFYGHHYGKIEQTPFKEVAAKPNRSGKAKKAGAR